MHQGTGFVPIPLPVPMPATRPVCRDGAMTPSKHSFTCVDSDSHYHNCRTSELEKFFLMFCFPLLQNENQ